MLCFSSVHAGEIVTAPRDSYFTNYFSKGVTSPTIGELVDVVNEYKGYENSLCLGGWCTDVLYSKTAVPSTPGSYWVGENTGTQRNVVTGQVYGVHLSPMSVTGGSGCYWPFTARTNNGVMSCVYNEVESNACPVGNPIDIATGIKYEQELDYTSADGVLKVERFYINQNTGWVIDPPITLNVLPAGSEKAIPQYAYKQVVEYTKSILQAPATSYRKIYHPRLYNPTANRIVYVWLGRKMFSFIEGNASTFSSDSMDGKKNLLQEISVTDMPNAKWKLILENKDIYYFSENGTTLKTLLSNGGVINYEYTDGKLSAKVDHTGRRLTYAYDTDGRLATITQPDNNIITYTYGTDKDSLDYNFLKKVSWPTGESISYLYNEPSNVTGINPGTVALTAKLDTNGQRIGNYKYNGQYAVSTEGYTGIKKKQLTFSAYSTTVTDALNSSRTYNFYQPKDGQRFLNGTSQPAGSGCSASTKSVEYYLETDLKKVEADFNGNKQQFAYDMGRKLETVRVEGVPKSDSTDYLPDSKVLAMGIRKISTQWHGQWRNPVKKAEPKIITTSIYNGDVDPFNGNQIANCSSLNSIPLLCHQVQQATTDANGQLGFSAILDTTISKREWVYTYNAQGQLLTRKRGGASVADETREYYDVSSADYRVGDLKSITNALGHKIQYVAYDANGYAKKVLDANNVETQFTYDARGRLLTQTTAQATTTHTYDINGNRDTSTFPNGMLVDYEYDPAKRLISISNVSGEKINYEYDLESNLRFERITNSGGALTYIKEHIYDALSREKSLVNSFNQSRTYLYDPNGNPTGEIDAKSQTTSRTFNALNQLKLSTDALNGITDYSYDKQGRITEVKDPKGHATTYIYNAFGELTQQISPDTGTTTFTYYPNGNRSSATDARNVVVNYTYDALDRLKSVSYPAAATENVTYTYDNTANGSYGIGRLTSVSTAAVRNDYEYNSKGLISKKFTQVGTLLSTTQYSYDAAGQLSSILYPSGRSVTYIRDSLGRVQSISTKADANAISQTVAANLAYLPFGPVSSYSYGNGLTHTNTFDTDYRLKAVQVGSVLSRSYGYDANDNIDSITNLIAATKNQAFGYDALDRLTSATGVYGSLGYTYDAVGNRLTEKVGVTTSTYNYETTSNRLSGITAPGVARAFTYDTAGNRTQGTTEDNKVQNYTYNKANRLATAKVGTTLVGTYTYNALGQRVSKVAGSVKEFYHYDEAGQLIAVTDASGKYLREYIYNGNQLVSFVTVAYPSIPAISLTSSKATFQGAAALEKIQTGYTGTVGYVHFTGEGQATWPVTITSTASYSTTLRYSLTGTDRPLALLIDGVQKDTVSFPATTNLNTWGSARVTLSLALTAGNHTLTLKTMGSGGPNIDTVGIGAVSGQTAAPVSTLYYVHNDHQGTPQVVTNQAKAVMWMADYQPFGKLQPGQTNSIELYSRFPGQYLDSETGNYYNYFRDYDPSVGRYIESDPIGLEGGINTYAYVEENPFKGIDPYGLKFVPHPDNNGRGLNTPVCQAGKAYYLLDNPRNKNYKSDAVAQCMAEHERNHIREALAQNINLCQGSKERRAIGNDDPNEFRQSELNAFDSELKCLEEKKKQSCIKSDIDDIDKRVNEINNTHLPNVVRGTY
jgi:RHS repeat-associated protein